MADVGMVDSLRPGIGLRPVEHAAEAGQRAGTPETGFRNIVLFSDGTGNSSASLFKTNVRRLYEALDVVDPGAPTPPRQFAFYDDGVGSSGFKPLALLGGAFGLGLTTNVRDLYASLCRTYRPGDKIFGFGFSRGAFTMRILVGLIMNQGIVPYDGNEANLARRTKDAFRAYRIEKYSRGAGMRLATRLGLAKPSAGYDKTLNHGHPGAGPEKAARVAFLGLWDTVDAYGLPIDELTWAVDRWIWPLTMSDAVLCDRVDRACHALSLDDERQTFHPRLWTEKAPSKAPSGDSLKDSVDGERITQVWFPGVHADLGGGYPDDGLAHNSLLWMMRHAKARGLRFMLPVLERYHALADENGLLHDSRRGLAGYYRYKPRDVPALIRQTEGHFGLPYVWLDRPKVHESVLRRMAVNTAGYAPLSLCAPFDVVRVGDLKPPLPDADQDTVEPVDIYLGRTHVPVRDALFQQRCVQVWNWVWRRRVAYFTALAGSLGLLLMPLAWGPTACVTFWCGFSPIFTGLAAVLPATAGTWLDVFAAHPFTTFVLAAVAIGGALAGRRLETSASDDMRLVWTAYRQTPGDQATAAPPATAGWNAKIQALRTSERYRRAVHRGRVAFTGASALFAGYLALGLINMGLLSLLEAAGANCAAEDTLEPLALGQSVDRAFSTLQPCHSMGVKLDEGVRYRLEVRAGANTWRDKTIPAGPNGLDWSRVGAIRQVLFGAAVPFRRHVGEPWFKLMARIGEQGRAVHAPDWRLVVGGDGVARYEAVLAADRTGALFLYVNDMMPFVFRSSFYKNNDGGADVKITAVSAARP
jgi:uncharacterized protein (DUF2235 family)